MEIYEGRTHVGELMWDNGEIWRNVEEYEEIWGDIDWDIWGGVV